MQILWFYNSFFRFYLLNSKFFYRIVYLVLLFLWALF